jgi:recombination protein RecR
MLPQPIKRFIDLFARLPGIGPRQASRIAFWVLRRGRNEVRSYQLAIQDLAEKVEVCPQCFFVFENGNANTLCAICRNPSREQNVIAVVEKETDLVSIEKTKRFNGLYHILGGLISPIDDEANKYLKVPQLLKRIEDSSGGIHEVILAFGHTTEGDLTVMELEKILRPLGITITRLGLGLPRGAEVEFADEDTLANAIERRQ